MKRIVLFLSIIIATSSLLLAFFYQTGMIKYKQIITAGQHITVVQLKSTKATPDIVIVKVGDFVQFNTEDGTLHQLAQGHGTSYGDIHEHDIGGLESPNFGGEEAYRIQFKKEGIYDFHDHLHPDIHITVIAK